MHYSFWSSFGLVYVLLILPSFVVCMLVFIRSLQFLYFISSHCWLVLYHIVHGFISQVLDAWFLSLNRRQPGSFWITCNDYTSSCLVSLFHAFVWNDNEMEILDTRTVCASYLPQFDTFCPLTIVLSDVFSFSYWCYWTNYWTKIIQLQFCSRSNLYLSKLLSVHSLC